MNLDIKQNERTGNWQLYVNDVLYHTSTKENIEGLAEEMKEAYKRIFALAEEIERDINLLDDGDITEILRAVANDY